MHQPTRRMIQATVMGAIAVTCALRFRPAGAAGDRAESGGFAVAIVAVLAMLAYLLWMDRRRRQERAARPKIADGMVGFAVPSAARPPSPPPAPAFIPDCAACYGEILSPSIPSRLHAVVQDETAPGWIALLALIAEAERSGAIGFAPGQAMPADQWKQVATLPPSIGRLKRLRTLNLYGSSIAWLPQEIGDLEALEMFTPYTSRRLHWFPYELTRCTRLRDSSVSTRRMYGNERHRPPFPDLRAEPFRLQPGQGSCSICRRAETGDRFPQYWLSLRVATDVMPLLARCCSAECLARLPSGSEGYLANPHQGGMDLVQPPAGEEPWMDVGGP